MSPTPNREDRKKQSAALSSLLAAGALTAFKVVVGSLTGSLGILAEAAHSALDLVAALTTFLAVRISGRPPDTTHPYGHGKVENISALFETLLLLATCVWIVMEAVHRLRFHALEVEVTAWSFVVMATSIVIDASRARMLSRVAKKYNSQALEADARHFQTDIWSSSVVIVGLMAVKIAEWFPSLGWLRAGDAVAALGVSAIVVWIGVRLGRRTVEALLDTAPAGLERRIAEAVKAVPGVRDCHNIRIHPSGPELFVDLHVLADGGLTLAQAHALTEVIEGAIQRVAPGADVTVHPEPV
jgi:cation diffusion facilitator family transporter